MLHCPRRIIPVCRGRFIGVTKNAILVQTGQGVLRLLEIQPANKKRMAVADYVVGHHIDVGIRCVGKSGQENQTRPI